MRHAPRERKSLIIIVLAGGRLLGAKPNVRASTWRESTFCEDIAPVPGKPCRRQSDKPWPYCCIVICKADADPHWTCNSGADLPQAACVR